MRSKKGLSLLFCTILIFTLCSCSFNSIEHDLTMEKIVEANKNETLLSTSNSFYVYCSYDGGKYEYFVNSKLSYGFDGETHEVINNEGYFQKTNLDEYITVLYAGENPALNSENMLISGETTLSEEIVECDVSKGKVFVKTRLPAEIYTKHTESAENGEYLEVDYVLDKKTLAISEMKETVFKADGTESKVINYVVEYNKTVPVVVNDILFHIAAGKQSVKTGQTKTRTVEIILDPDTENEKSYSKKVLTGTNVSIICPDEYETIYEDKALQKEFTKDHDMENDLTVYAAKGK